MKVRYPTSEPPISPRVLDILRAISYKVGWELQIHTMSYRTSFPIVVRATFPVTDVNIPTAAESTLYGEAVFIQDYMGEKDIIKLVFEALLRAEIHEAAEQFNYKAIRVFNPHIATEDQKKLMGLAVDDDLITSDIAQERDLMSLKELYPADFLHNE